MNFPATHAPWMWLTFGTLGSVSTVLFVVYAGRVRRGIASMDRSAAVSARIRFAAVSAFYASAFSACGIGGPPGNLLGTDPRPFIAAGAAAGAMGFGTLAFLLLLLSERRRS